MLTYVWEKQKTKKFLALNAGYFIFFMAMYTLVDSFNMTYATMTLTYGVWLTVINIVLNLIMATLSMLMMSLTTAQFDFTGKESKGSNVPFLSVLFGILTYGCTACVIGFFAAVGITFSVMILPFAGLPYKLISLVVVILGFLWVLNSIRRASCKR
jgi:hypothetical protein